MIFGIQTLKSSDPSTPEVPYIPAIMQTVLSSTVKIFGWPGSCVRLSELDSMLSVTATKPLLFANRTLIVPWPSLSAPDVPCATAMLASSKHRDVNFIARSENGFVDRDWNFAESTTRNA